MFALLSLLITYLNLNASFNQQSDIYYLRKEQIEFHDSNELTIQVKTECIEGLKNVDFSSYHTLNIEGVNVMILNIDVAFRPKELIVYEQNGDILWNKNKIELEGKHLGKDNAQLVKLSKVLSDK